MRSRKRLIFSAISAPESSCRKCRPVTSSGPSACGNNSLKRVANVLWSNTSSSLPHTRSVGSFDFFSSRSSHSKRANPRALSSSGIQRGQVHVRRRDPGSGEYAFVDALSLCPELLPVDHRKIHAATRKRVVAPEKIRTERRRVHHAPRKYPVVEFGRRQRPGPRAHDDQSADAVGVG